MTPVYARRNGVRQDHIELLFTGDQSCGLQDPFSSPPYHRREESQRWKEKSQTNLNKPKLK